MNSLILKWTTLLAIISAVLMAGLGIVSQFYTPVETRFEWYMSVLLLVLAGMMSYLYSKIELIENQTKQVVDKIGLKDFEVFRTRDEFFSRMIETTAGSQMVSTQMFSDPPSEIGGQMESYFRKIGIYTRKNPRMVFRRIITLGDTCKVKWIMTMLDEMAGTQNFSLAYIEVNHKQIPLLCVHIVEKDGELFTSVFHTVPSSGNINAFLIRSREVGQVVLDYYNGLWEKSPKLMEGRNIHKKAIEELAERYGVEHSMEYVKLMNKIV